MQKVFNKWFPKDIVEQAKVRLEEYEVSFESAILLPNLQVFSGHIISPVYQEVHEIWGRAYLYFRVGSDPDGNFDFGEIEFKNSDGEFVRRVRKIMKTPEIIPEDFFNEVAEICSNPVFQSHRTSRTRDISKES